MTLEEKLSKALTYRTVSTTDTSLTRFEEFSGYMAFIRAEFPRFAALEWETIAAHSYIVLWRGRGEGKPFAFLSHYDVVPAEPEGWKHEPFAGERDARYVYGRGAMDMKGHMLSLIDAAEGLLAEGFVPGRDIYFCFGHDEETVPPENGGAQCIVRTLTQRGISFELVMDEGLSVTDAGELGLSGRAALVCVAEKGYLDLRMTASAQAGHASRPTQDAAVFTLARALCAIAGQPFALRRTPLSEAYMSAACELMSEDMRALCRSDRDALMHFEAQRPERAALYRTTVAPTMLSASAQANVLSDRASAVLNIRALAPDTTQRIIERLEKVVNDPRISFEVLRSFEASRLSDTASAAFVLVSDAVKDVYKGVSVLPYLMTAGTDSRYYKDIAESIIRFTPMYIEKDSGMHGVNERLLISSLYEGRDVFRYILSRA